MACWSLDFLKKRNVSKIKSINICQDVFFFFAQNQRPTHFKIKKYLSTKDKSAKDCVCTFLLFDKDVTLMEKISFSCLSARFTGSLSLPASC